MRPLTERLGLPIHRGPKIMIVGAHADDAEIGASGTIGRLVAERRDVEVTWVVLATADHVRANEARDSAERLLGGVAHHVVLGDLRDGYLPYTGPEAKEWLAIHQAVDPDLIIGPRRDDAHQDHRLVAELLPQLFRASTILEYEVPKRDGDFGPANLYVPLTAADATGKVHHLVDMFPSQGDRDWFRAETFEAVLRLRGMECRAPERLAEAFVCRKLVV